MHFYAFRFQRRLRDLEFWLTKIEQDFNLVTKSQMHQMGRRACRRTRSRQPSRLRCLGLSASIPCADHVSLAGGSRVRGRRHFMPAPLSLPRAGYLYIYLRFAPRPSGFHPARERLPR